MNPNVHLQPNIRYEVHHGPISTIHGTQLTPLRLEAFTSFPYLYCGNPEREMQLWDRLSQKKMFLVLAYDNKTLVGAIIATELGKDDYPALHTSHQFALANALEIDMIMVANTHQRCGIGRCLLDLFYIEARAGKYTDAYGLVVVRSEHHPLKPKEFIDLPHVWARFGWQPTGITEPWNWPTRCGVPGNEFVAPVDNTVQYWHKRL